MFHSGDTLDQATAYLLRCDKLRLLFLPVNYFYDVFSDGLDNALIFKKTVVQIQYGIINLVILEDKTDIDLGGTLAHHFNLDVLRTEYPEHCGQNLR